MNSRIKPHSFILKTPIAHRGLHSDKIPENSPAAFEAAMIKNYAIETDVRLTSDKKVIIFHDDSLERMCGVKAKVIEKDLEEIQKLKLKNSDEKIITLSEFLKLIDGKVPLLIEIKNNGKVGILENLVVEELKNYKGEFAVQAFNPFVLEYFKDNAPDILRGILSCYFKGEKLAFYKKFLLKSMRFNKRCEPDFISYAIENLPNRYVEKYKDLPLLAWTIRTEKGLEKAKALNANVIFENDLFNAE